MQKAECGRLNGSANGLQVTGNRENLSPVPYHLSPVRYCVLIPAYCVLLSASCLAQQPAPPAPASPVTEDEEAPLPGDWAPELLYGILSSPNPEARDALFDAAFAAGPAIVPQLQVALKDDRTAEFAAQSLAFIGGGKALEILSELLKDPRDLDLRRYYYGALGEYRAPQASQVLLYAVNRADAEPDRTVTEAAILALTVRSDPSLVFELRQTEARIKDVVIHDDLENALDVIESRARYLASPEGKKAGGSIEQAVRTYFIPALESVSAPVSSKPPTKKVPATATPAVKVEVQNLTLSPDKTRGLAHVVFEDPSARAYYDMVLQKQAGDWTVASVWLGSEVEKRTSNSPSQASKPNH